jgi:hypothetical protein
MATDVKVFGRVRKLLEAVDTEAAGADPVEDTLTPQLEKLVAQGAAANQEFVRVGRAFWIGTTTAVAAVIAIPTTAVMLALFNNDPDSGRSLIIDWVAASGVAKTAAAGQQQLLGLIGQARETAPTNSALVAKKRNGLGGGSPDTKALSIVGGTVLPAGTGVAANWFPIGPSFGSPGAGATPGHGAYQAVNGDIIVPPGRYFAMHVLADVVGSTYQGFIGWHELQTALG